MIKSSVLFYAFLAIGIIGFLTMTISLKLDIIKKYEAYFDNNKIVINENLNNIDSLYVYKSLNEKVYSFFVKELNHVEQYTVLYVSNENEDIKNNLLGVVNLEIVTGKKSLFELIYIQAGKKRDER